jgi:hypothetical protein
MAKTEKLKPANKVMSDGATRAKYPRQSVESALRIPKAILEQNAGKACTPQQAATLLGFSTAKGPFGVEISSATKYGFLSRSDGKLQPTDLARRILRPTTTDDALKGYREAILNRARTVGRLQALSWRESSRRRDLFPQHPDRHLPYS